MARLLYTVNSSPLTPVTSREPLPPRRGGGLLKGLDCLCLFKTSNNGGRK